MATLKDLLEISPDDWDKLGDTELQTILEPYLKVTRPTKELAAHKPVTKGKASAKSSTNVMDLFKQLTSMQKQMEGK